jgi:hypothetical protein
MPDCTTISPLGDFSHSLAVTVYVLPHGAGHDYLPIVWDQWMDDPSRKSYVVVDPVSGRAAAFESIGDFDDRRTKMMQVSGAFEPSCSLCRPPHNPTSVARISQHLPEYPCHSGGKFPSSPTHVQWPTPTVLRRKLRTLA